MTSQTDLLLEGLSNVCARTSELHSGLKASAKNSPFRKKSAVLEQLGNVVTIAETCIQTGKTVRNKPRTVKKNLTFVLNSMASIRDGIEDQELNLTETKHTLSAQVMPAVYALESVIESMRSKVESEKEINRRADQAWRSAVKDSDKDQPDMKQALAVAKKASELAAEAREREEIELDLAQRKASTQQLQSYRKFSKRLLKPDSPEYKRMLEHGTSMPVECPIFVSFATGRLRDLTSLDSLGFKYTPVSSRSSETADVALILEDQVLLQFSKKAAFTYFENRVAQMRKEISSGSDTKAVRVKRKELKALDSRIVKTQSNFEKQNATTRQMTQKLLDKLEAEREKLEGEIAHYEETIKQKRHKIVVFKREVFQLSNLKSETPSKTKRRMLKPKAIELYLYEILKQFSDAGHEFSMLSNQFINNTASADIQMAWLVRSEQAKVIRELYGDMNIVVNWGLPWKSY